MIYSIIIFILSLLLFPVHSFYITNAAVVEQCSTGPILYLNKFDSNKMHCLNQAVRHVFIFLEYSCFQNTLTRIWTIRTDVNKGLNWPQEIDILTGKDYTRFDKISIKEDPTIEEEISGSFDSNNNQLTTYMWTSLSNGPQCRIKYTNTKDICTKKGALGAKFTDFICYYGKQAFNLKTIEQRQALDKLLDNSIKAGSNTAQTIPNNSQNNPNPSALNPNLPALNPNESSFWKKNQLYIIIVGIIVVVIILIVIILIIVCLRQSSNKDLKKRMSDDSNVE